MKIKRPAFIPFCFLIFDGQVFAQNKVEADMGVGLFEGESLKVNYGNNVQVALCQGIAQKSF